MEEKFWQYFSYGYFIIQTVCIFIMLEFLLYGFPHFTCFALVFLLFYELNKKLIFKPRGKKSLQLN
ncbi:hypothetical protein A3F57_01615 [Candidatus Roizmanbacteria bacterium RIFCSPHIGHO2_12_FULL_36_11]|nr:MAG: hypothetical protein A3F57_01615 [Candidatus Roizmanbacteria bacterium RIFCSPHIGHO2_12_FULL_36_11]